MARSSRYLLSAGLVVAFVICGASGRVWAKPSPNPIPPGAISLAEAVESLVPAHEWKALLARCDPNHRKAQKQMGMSDAQYLAEILGLHRVGNNIKRGKRLTYADLGRIRRIVVKKFIWDGSRIAVSGTVELRGGGTLSLSLSIRKLGARYVLTGAMG